MKTRSSVACGQRGGAVLTLFLIVMGCAAWWGSVTVHGEPPNIVLCMTDDQGYGDVGYMGHPELQTPVLDEMASEALRFDRFYAAAPVCSPTRGSVLTGRHPNRFGCFKWGHTLRSEEITLAEILQREGYRTGHFGKWHIGPVVKGAEASPGESGFDVWVSAPNFYDNDPWMSRNGKAEQLHGESSAVTVEAALEFIRESAEREAPFLAVVWFGNPHTPHEATEELQSLYPDQSEEMQNYYGEITGIDRAMGRLREGLREAGVAEDTLLWYTSDNGGRKPHASNGGLRGQKGGQYEGGIRVPAIIEWPGRVAESRITEIPASTVDMLPTVLDVIGARDRLPERPLDGESLARVIDGKVEKRDAPLGFWEYPIGGRGVRSGAIVKRIAEAQAEGRDPEVEVGVLHGPDKEYPKADELPGWAAWISGDYKLHRRGEDDLALYNLEEDPKEQQNRIEEEPERARRMHKAMKRWMRSVVGSLRGQDY